MQQSNNEFQMVTSNTDQDGPEKRETDQNTHSSLTDQNVNQKTYQNVDSQQDKHSNEELSEPDKADSELSFVDQSYEVISRDASMTKANNQGSEQDVASFDPSSKAMNDRSEPSSSDSLSTTLQAKIRNSSSFFANRSPTSRTQRTEPISSAIPSSIVGALSSLSSTLASNFNSMSISPSSDHKSAGHANKIGQLSSSPSSNKLAIETSLSIGEGSSNRPCPPSAGRGDVHFRKAAQERKNLISLTKLIVKDLISTSIGTSRTIDDGHNCNLVHVNNYFTLIDRVLKHGLKQNFLTGKSVNLWTALENLPRYLKESTLITESVRSLANTKSADGKIKAWMRLAMMQKKLPEYFSELLLQKSTLLKDVYHDYGFMLNEEAHVFAGLIIGVNVIDCNYFVKDANFDLMDDILDLTPYLRAATSFDDDPLVQSQDSDISRQSDQLRTTLDQKNYLEERTKKLETTIYGLRAKILSLEDQNSRLEMEARLSEVRIQKLQAFKKFAPTNDKLTKSGTISDAIHNLITRDSNPSNGDQIGEKSTSANRQENKEALDSSSESLTNDDSSVSHTLSVSTVSNIQHQITNEPNQYDHLRSKYEEEFQKQVAEQSNELEALRERTNILEASYRAAIERIKSLERDLDIQTSMNSDKETTIKIYEKDIRDKQAQVETLRNSLSDAKKLNNDLSASLNDASTKLKERVKMVSNLQSSVDKWKLENKTLAARFQDKLTALKSLSKELDESKRAMADMKDYNMRINEELRRERESGQSSSVKVETQNDRIGELTDRLAILEDQLKEQAPFRRQKEELEKRCQDYELSLEQLGEQLRVSKLELESLRENSAVFLDSQWQDSKQIKECALCQLAFSVTRRKHHCRLCGNVFCQTCSDNKMELASSSKPLRVCDTCHSFLLAKFVKTSTQ